MSLMLGIWSKSDHKSIVDEFCSNRDVDSLIVDDVKFYSYMGDIFSDKDLAVCFAGQLFENGKSIDKPAQRILLEYKRQGNDVFRALDGNFSVAIYDKRKGELFIASDAFGTYPLFVLENANTVAFCTEFEPLSKRAGKVNKKAISEFLDTGAVIGNKTFFTNIRNISPGTVVSIGNERAEQVYFDANFQVRHDSISKSAERVMSVFKKAVAKRSNKTCELTGGADTRLILLSMSTIQRKNTKFITYNHPDITQAEDKEVIISQMLANRYNIVHSIVEKDSAIAYLPTFFDDMRKIPSEKFLSGYYGREFLGGAVMSHSPIKFGNHKSANLKKHMGMIRAENRELFLQISLFTRSFCLDCYQVSDFLMPYRVITRYDSPFLDKDFLIELLRCPMEHIRDYKLYNHILAELDAVDIPTNSLLATDSDSPLQYLKNGTDHRDKRNKRESIIRPLYRAYNRNKNKLPFSILEKHRKIAVVDALTDTLASIDLAYYRQGRTNKRKMIIDDFGKRYLWHNV